MGPGSAPEVFHLEGGPSVLKRNGGTEGSFPLKAPLCKGGCLGAKRRGWGIAPTAGGPFEEKGAAKLSDTNRGLITVITLIAALVLSRVGVVTLIEQGYSYLSYGFILFYLLPTLLVGGYKIIKHKDK